VLEPASISASLKIRWSCTDSLTHNHSTAVHVNTALHCTAKVCSRARQHLPDTQCAPCASNREQHSHDSLTVQAWILKDRS
jgi:hypothetical protein